VLERHCCRATPLTVSVSGSAPSAPGRDLEPPGEAALLGHVQCRTRDRMCMRAEILQALFYEEQVQIMSADDPE